MCGLGGVKVILGGNYSVLGSLFDWKCHKRFGWNCDFFCRCALGMGIANNCNQTGVLCEGLEELLLLQSIFSDLSRFVAPLRNSVKVVMTIVYV